MRLLTLVIALFALEICTRCSTSSSTGSLDTSFGTSGIVTTDFNSSTDELKAIALQSDGKIIAVGRSLVSGTYDFAIARYTSSGVLDTTFGTNGLVTTDFSSQNDTAYAVKVLSDDSFIVGGTTASPTTAQFALAKYGASGSLDITFGTSGKVTTAIGTGIDEIRSLAIQSSDSYIVAGGFSQGATYYRMAVARYTTSGTLDTNFNTTGKKTLTIGSTDCWAYDVLAESSGVITLAGAALGSVDRDFAMARLTSAGALDTTFNSSGTLTFAIGSGTTDTAYSLKKTSDSKYVVSGNSLSGSDDSIAVARLSSAGVLDSTFATSGVGTFQVKSYNSSNVFTAYSTAGKAGVLLTGDKVVLAGTQSATTLDFGFLKLTSSGVIDSSFGTQGYFKVDFGSNLDDLAALALQSDGKIIAGGRVYNGSNYDFGLVRLQ